MYASTYTHTKKAPDKKKSDDSSHLSSTGCYDREALLTHGVVSLPPCRSFMYIEKDTECWTAQDNSKTERVMRRASAALYENKGRFRLSVYLSVCLYLSTDY